MQLFGVPRSVGQIYGLLFASPFPLSFSDIVERLKISKGSASQGMQLLRSIGAIKVAETGDAVDPQGRSAGRAELSRREYYEPELRLRKLMSGILRERIAPLAADGRERVVALKELATSADGNSGFYLGRVRQLETWRRRLKTVLPLLNVMLGPKEP